MTVSRSSNKPHLKDLRSGDSYARVVLDFTNVDLGLDPKLKKECQQNARRHAAKLFQVLDKKGASLRPNTRFEGRGIYRPIDSRNRRFVYVKGVGNVDVLNDPCPSEYPGFGRNSKLFIDELTGINASSHPRIIGTETVLWGALEFVTAASIFADLVEELNIKSLEQARRLKLTIPIGVAKFEGLSNFEAREIYQFVKNSCHEPTEQKSALWQGNFMGLGSVALEVPSNKRMQNSPNLVDFRAQEKLNFQKRTNLSNIYTLCKTLQNLLRIGYIYSNSSSHLQNIYAKPGSHCAQADNSDILHLESVPAEILTQNVSKKDLQIELIAHQFVKGFLYFKLESFSSEEYKSKLRTYRAKLIKNLLGLENSFEIHKIKGLVDLFETKPLLIARSIARILYEKILQC